ncbi:DUF1700 domain-containing protein [Lactobacillus sp. 3B(2020)]|uniref:DUF1700 domain-containing protein n=1 Tax=Lactobacillus sp. 3B(2020) TaxID=2695882 RepID=UPI0015DD63D7|nr:DUF1700 domain-containing protein [Lactobacillus sp. 3B(2020)]QLL69300.1 DUF1700 domain-containing protein [Lactobacillus sp. 3B(2020)]
MNSEVKQYLSELQHRLRRLPAEDLAEVMEYYTEYCEDASFTNRQAVEKALGSPRTLSLQILAEHSFDAKPQGHWWHPETNIKTAWLVVLALLASPVTFFIGIILLAGLIAVIAVIFSIVVAAIALIGSAILVTGAFFYVGIALLFTKLGVGLFYLGLGFAFLGLGLLIITIGTWFCLALIRLVTRGCQWLYHRFVKREGVK